MTLQFSSSLTLAFRLERSRVQRSSRPLVPKRSRPGSFRLERWLELARPSRPSLPAPFGLPANSLAPPLPTPHSLVASSSYSSPALLARRHLLSLLASFFIAFCLGCPFAFLLLFSANVCLQVLLQLAEQNASTPRSLLS